MRRCASDLCKDLREAIELTTNAQHVASELDYTVRMQSAYIKHVRMHTVLLARGTNGPRIQRWTCVRSKTGVRWVCARCAVGVRQNIQRIPNVWSACVWRWSSALRTCLASFWHVHSCVELRAHFQITISFFPASIPSYVHPHQPYNNFPLILVSRFGHGLIVLVTSTVGGGALPERNSSHYSNVYPNITTFITLTSTRT